jgi:hypothetical protein
MDKLYVVARDRSVLVDPNMTIRDVIKYLDSNNQTFSLRRTLQLYGLHFVEERSFSSKYRQVFQLSSTKSMYDIKIKELDQYKQELFVSSIRMK